MNSPLWSLLPTSALPLVIAGVGLALIVGIIKPRKAGAIIGFLVLSLLLAPFFQALLDSLPWWVCLALTIVFVLSLLKAAFQLMIGGRATDHVVGALTADVIRMFLRGLLFPFRVLGRMLVR